MIGPVHCGVSNAVSCSGQWPLLLSLPYFRALAGHGGILINGSHNDVCNSSGVTSSTTNSTIIILGVNHSYPCENLDLAAHLQCLACSVTFRGNAPRNSFPKRSGIVLVATAIPQP